MKKNTVLTLFFISAIAAVAITFILLGKKAVDFTDRSYIWYVDYNEKSDNIFIVRGKKIGEIRSDANKLVAALNAADADPGSFRTSAEKESGDPPKVKLMKIEDGVAFVEIMNAEYLTQRMGSSGAQDYLASVTYTLTEDRQIKKINFIFEEGDHAVPGVYTRETFANYKIVTEDSR
jgi:spore germination protein GerM